MMPILYNTFSQALLLPSEKTKYTIKYNLDGLLRGHYESRMNGYAVGRQNGWLSANDIRELENMNRIPAAASCSLKESFLMRPGMAMKSHQVFFMVS